MNNIIKITPDIVKKRCLTLISLRNRAYESKTNLIATIILNSPLLVVAGNDWLPAYELTRNIRKKTLEVRQALNRLHTIRTSTCYRLLDSLANIPSSGEPILVLEFLHTFYDSDIPLNVRFHKLQEGCRYLERLALYRPVLVLTQEMISRDIEVEDYKKFFPILQSTAGKTFYLEGDEPRRIVQPAFF
ncbi:MAG: hypothetical protein H7Y59_03175 [Anaerolineales bacterium]|nr:hypothetical protein [Anaerolineales bacterium]